VSRDPVHLTATSSQTVGPFFHFGLAGNPALGCMAGPAATGTRIRLRIRAVEGDGVPVPDALIELWQADADGQYVTPADASRAGAQPAFTGFGRLPSGADGTCLFETVHPGRVRDEHGREQAPHINVCFFARGLLRQIYTRIYFEGDAGLDEDPILALVPAERRSTLMAQRVDDEWQFDIRLQGDRETVFFDL
jgi:protocatechuate 3,4-dioxygenase, alpha subunit